MEFPQWVIHNKRFPTLTRLVENTQEIPNVVRGTKAEDWVAFKIVGEGVSLDKVLER